MVLARYCKNEQGQCLARLSKKEQDFLAGLTKILFCKIEKDHGLERKIPLASAMRSMGPAFL